MTPRACLAAIMAADVAGFSVAIEGAAEGTQNPEWPIASRLRFLASALR
ncbi:exported hypothetical protein [Mesorhizobium sp. ORS 3324]|nr:exported hypothetical protein [Mesorhizobium sp. ORS 3324]